MFIPTNPTAAIRSFIDQMMAKRQSNDKDKSSIAALDYLLPASEIIFCILLWMPMSIGASNSTIALVLLCIVSMLRVGGGLLVSFTYWLWLTDSDQFRVCGAGDTMDMLVFGKATPLFQKIINLIHMGCQLGIMIGCIVTPHGLDFAIIYGLGLLASYGSQTYLRYQAKRRLKQIDPKWTGRVSEG